MDRTLDMLFNFLSEPDSFTLLESFPLNLRYPFLEGTAVIQYFFFPFKTISRVVCFHKVWFHLEHLRAFDPGIFHSSVFLSEDSVGHPFPSPQKFFRPTEC